ncbi:hypothetical protein SSX86_027226 [Deinandra increscens subsp. villosa]|uniref:Splicing factor 3A subunit 1 n=1 Tax=Deinandra increscens subsp. villosa TaxID=3103831 RepID=A0AAP0CLQ9_9ASTR
MDIMLQEAAQKNTNSTPGSIATHTRAIGIIHPPQDIRTIVDKTAQFVAKSGPEIEKRIIIDYARKHHFNFLHSSDPYHTYYQHRLSEFRSQNQAPMQQPATPADCCMDAIKKTDPSPKFRPVKKVLDPPEAEQYTIWVQEGIIITCEELDVIKLTAQFVALKGESFLTGLAFRESNNPQFHFLKPTHSLNMLFKSLADAYLKVLRPPKGLIDKLRNGVSDITTVVERCLHRLEWERSQEQARQKDEDEMKHEKLLMSNIDWHDFVVVETILFADEDDLPPPMTLEEVKKRRSKIAVVEEEHEMEVEMEMEMELDVQLVQEGMRATTLEGDNSVNAHKKPRMRIVKNYKRPEERLAAATGEKNLSSTVVSPITGELIPVNEMSEHMRISLIDPKYKEQKERMYAKIRETILAQDDEISRNITGLASTRPDIFGTTEEEVSNAVKAEIVKKHKEQQQQVIWPLNAAEDQINCQNLPGPAAPLSRPGLPSLHRLSLPPGLGLNLPCVPCSSPQPVQMIYGQQQPYMMNQLLLPMSVNPPSISVPPPPPGSQFTAMSQHGTPIIPPAPMPQVMRPPPPEEPEPKRQRLDDSLLVPEDQFLAQHPGRVRISVLVPNVNEGNLRGQVLEISVDSLAESVSSLKEKIAGEIQLPANKQKLSSGKSGFLKDNLSLAYYNVGGGEMFSLTLRERGGRKR